MFLRPSTVSKRFAQKPQFLSPTQAISTQTRKMATGAPSDTAQVQKDAENSTQSGSFADYGIENTTISHATGISLSNEQKVIVGSVLDLFAGRPSLKKLSLWSDTAKFQDPLTKAEGRKQYEPQWYGLQTAFSEIERLHHQVTSSGNPIEMDLKTRYKIKGVGIEKTIESKIKIWIEGGKIVELQDRWDGELPEGAFATAFRKLNSVVVPMMVGVPKNEAEDREKGN